MTQTICDKTAFSILTRLYENPEGLRFRDLKKAIRITEPRLSRKLALLKSYRLVEVCPVLEEDDKYFAYRITDEGKEFANYIQIQRFLEKVEQLDLTAPQKKAHRRNMTP